MVKNEMLRMIPGPTREPVTLAGKNCMRNFKICTHHHRVLLGANQGYVACMGGKRNTYRVLHDLWTLPQEAIS